MPESKRIGEVLRQARERLKLTQSALAARVEIAPNHLLRIETGERSNPRFETIAKLAAELGLSLDELAALSGYREATKAGPRDRAAFAKAAEDLSPVADGLSKAADSLRKTIAALRSEAGPALRREKPPNTPTRRKRT